MNGLTVVNDSPLDILPNSIGEFKSDYEFHPTIYFEEVND